MTSTLRVNSYLDNLLFCVSVSKVVRVIRQPKGNMLLIGIGGSGRQSLTRLASFICDYTTFQIEVSKHYRKAEFRDGECVLIRGGQREWQGKDGYCSEKFGSRGLVSPCNTMWDIVRCSATIGVLWLCIEASSYMQQCVWSLVCAPCSSLCEIDI